MVNIYKSILITRLPGGASGKEPTCKHRRYKRPSSIPESGRSLEEGMVTHSSSLAWRILWTEEPGGLESDSEVN